jgi:hypothetical protein
MAFGPINTQAVIGFPIIGHRIAFVSTKENMQRVLRIYQRQTAQQDKHQ